MRCLTASVAPVGVHEGVGHPLVLLQSALLRHAAVQRAQLPTLLLPVGHGRLVDGHLLPTVQRQREVVGKDRETGGGQGVIIENERQRDKERKGKEGG